MEIGSNPSLAATTAQKTHKPVGTHKSPTTDKNDGDKFEPTKGDKTPTKHKTDKSGKTSGKGKSGKTTGTHKKPKPAPGPTVTGPKGDIDFTFNAKDNATMPAQDYLVHGLHGGSTVETDHIVLDGNLAPTAQGDYKYGDTTEQFHAVNSFASAQHNFDIVGKAFGVTQFNTPDHKLHVIPDKGVDLNAYYDRNAINFFHDTDPKTGKVIFSADGGDVVEHESDHAVLDAVRPGYFEAFSPTPGAFHESFADVGAFLNATQDDAVVAKMVEQTKGDLTITNSGSESARQLGDAINDEVGSDVTGGHYIRNMRNDLKYADPTTLPDNPKDPKQLGSEAHNFSRLWSGAFYDIFTGMVSNHESADKMDPATAIKTSSKEALASYAALFTANGKGDAPEGDFTYKDMANAWIKSDKENNGGKLAPLIAKVMSDRGILPKAEGLVANAAAYTLPSGTRDLTINLTAGNGIPAEFDGAKVTNKLSGSPNEGMFEDADAGISLQNQIAKDIKSGNILVRAPGATGNPSADELRKPDGHFYKAYLQTVDGEKTIIRSKIVE
jgi:hypothetical protein